MTQLSGWLLRHKLVVLGGWLVALLVGVVLAPTVSQRLSTDFSLPARVASYASSGDRRLVSADGRTTYGLVFPSDDGAADRGDPADATAAALRTALPAGTALEVTGIDQLSAHDDGGSAGAEVVNLTLIGGLGALAVLLLVFGSVLALAPLLVAAVAILATLLLVGLLTVLTEVNLIVEYLVALIGLGVAIDYSLLLVTRWREERTAGHAGDQAVHRAMASAGRSVVLSASTVAVGLLSLVVLPVPYLRSVGLAGLLIPVLSALVTVTLLPVVLAGKGGGSTGRGGGSGRRWEPAVPGPRGRVPSCVAAGERRWRQWRRWRSSAGSRCACRSATSRPAPWPAPVRLTRGWWPYAPRGCRPGCSRRSRCWSPPAPRPTPRRWRAAWRGCPACGRRSRPTSPPGGGAGTALVEVAAVAEPAASRPSNGSVPPCSAWHRARGSGASALRTLTLPARSTVASR
jgi:hypothetical protein